MPSIAQPRGWRRGRLLAPLLAFLPAAAAALTVDKAVITFNPKQTDAFLLRGRVAGLSLDGAAAVRLDFGTFSQTLPLARFAHRGGRLVYRAPPRAPGLRELVLDTRQGRLSAVAKRVVLAPFSNPAAVRLSAGAFEDCAMVQLSEGAKKWKLAGGSGSAWRRMRSGSTSPGTSPPRSSWNGAAPPSTTPSRSSLRRRRGALSS